jgi:hypothetical protein
VGPSDEPRVSPALGPSPSPQPKRHCQGEARTCRAERLRGRRRGRRRWAPAHAQPIHEGDRGQSSDPLRRNSFIRAPSPRRRRRSQDSPGWGRPVSACLRPGNRPGYYFLDCKRAGLVSIAGRRVPSRTRGAR